MSHPLLSSLRTRFFLFALMAVIPVGGLILWTTYEEWRSDTEAAEARALALANLTASDHAGLIEGVRQLLIGLCRAPEVRDQDLPACNVMFADLLKHNPQYANIGMMDITGDVVARGLPTTRQINVRGQSSAQLLDASAGFRVIGCEVGRVSGVSGLVCGQPVLDSEGHLKGAIAISLRTGWVNRFARRAALPPEATLTTINADGKIWSRYPDPDAWVNKVVPEASILAGVTEAGVKEAPGVDGTPNLYAFAPVDMHSVQGKVFTVLCLPRGAALAAAQRRLMVNLIELLLVSVAAVWAVSLAGHFLVFRRLGTLTAATQRLAGGDLKARAGMQDGPRELKELGQWFDDMAAALQRKTAQQAAAETALRASEERYRLLVETAEEGIWVIDADGRTTLANAKMASLVGQSPLSMIGTPLLEYIVAQDRPVAQGALERPGADSRDQHEFRFSRRDGSEFWAQVKTSPIVHGQIYAGALAMVSDITGRKLAEEQLRQSYSLLLAVVDGITDPVFVKDPEGRYLLINLAGALLSGRTPDQVVGLTDEQVFGPEEGLAHREADRRILAAGFGQTYEQSIFTAGFVRHFLTTKAPYRDAEGQILGLVGISRDITSRKWAERALKESESFLRDVLDSLLVFVAVLTPDGAVVQVNRTGLESLKAAGYEWEDFKGKGLDQTPWWSSSSEVQAQLRAAITRAAAGESSRFDTVYLQTGSHWRVVDFMLAPMFDAQGKVTHLIPSAIDITERKRAEERSQEQQAELAHLERVRTMSQMAAGLAHELTQPLGAIINYAGASAESVRTGCAEMPMLAEAMAEIQQEATRAGEIIRRLRGFVQKQRPDARPVDLNLLVRESMEILSFDLRQYGLKPQLELADPLPPVLADTVQVQQVLVNLVHNAMDAMSSAPSEDRRLRVRTSIAGPDHVRVEVFDNGCGVSPENLSHIFDAFFTTKTHGLGMGLALCRTIIEDHGGQLAGHPDPSGGMMFSFTLRAAS